MKLCELFTKINESFPIAKKTFASQGATDEEIKSYFNKYKKMKDRNIVPVEFAKDIVQWTRAGWDQFKKHVDEWEHSPSKKSLKKAPKPPSNEVITVYENDKWVVVVPLSNKASCFYGRDSGWCTSSLNSSSFADYFFSGSSVLIYVLSKINDRKIAIDKKLNSDHYVIHDYSNNVDVVNNDEKFTELTSLNAQDLIDEVENKHMPAIKQAVLNSKSFDPVVLAQDAIDQGARNTLAEPIIMKHPYAQVYASEFFPGERWPQAERAIIRNASTAAKYAIDTLKQRWPEAEKIIMKNPFAANLYATNIFAGRWPEAEPHIMKNPAQAYSYANNILKQRWPEAEPYIMKSPHVSNYIRNIIKGRWPEAEPHIMKNPVEAYKYANEVLKQRWPEAEKIIMKDPGAAHEYAARVLKGRWPEAEKAIMKDPRQAVGYARDVIKGRWPEAEPYIMKDEYWREEYNSINNGLK